MDIFENMSKITIGYDALGDLLMQTTNNPLAEEEIPAMLKEAISKGITVKLTDENGNECYQLVLDGESFKLMPV